MGTFHGTPVAVKTAKRSEGNLKRLSQFCNELRILRQVRHPDIVLFYGALIDPTLGSVSLVLELVEGRTLEQFLSSSGLGDTDHDTMCTRYHIIYFVSRALLFLHSRRPCIVHGDLSSQNILVQRIGDVAQPKLL